MKCPKCSMELPYDARFCGGCGRPTGAAKCSKCQMELPDDVRFCGACGTPTGAGPVGVPTSIPAQPGMSGGGPVVPDYSIWALLMAIFCCAPLGIMAFIFSSRARTARAVGNYPEAIRQAGTAKQCLIIGVVISAILMAGGILFGLLGKAFLPAWDDAEDYIYSSGWVGDRAGDRKVVSIRGVEYAFRWCPAGSFQMGSPSSESDRDSDEMQHSVTLTQGFWMLETEVTQEQWSSLMGSNPSWFSSSGSGKDKVSGMSTQRFPVESVIWTESQSYISKLNAELKVSGLEFALPTEAQWEYACRAGTTGAYAGTLDSMAWYSSNSGGRTHEVGTKSPNPWGLYDMHGNVWEWCADWYGSYPSGSVTDPVGANSFASRVLRGGRWCLGAAYCRSAYRVGFDPSHRDDGLGLRPVVRQVR